MYSNYAYAVPDSAHSTYNFLVNHGAYDAAVELRNDTTSSSTGKKGLRINHSATDNTTVDLRSATGAANKLSFRLQDDAAPSSFSDMMALTDDNKSSTAVYGMTIGGRVKSSQLFVGENDTRAPTSTGLYLGQDTNSGAYFNMNSGTGTGGFKFNTYDSTGTNSINNLTLNKAGTVKMPYYSATADALDTESNAAFATFDSAGKLVRDYQQNARVRSSENRANTLATVTLPAISDKVNSIINFMNTIEFFDSHMSNMVLGSSSSPTTPAPTTPAPTTPAPTTPAPTTPAPTTPAPTTPAPTTPPPPKIYDITTGTKTLTFNKDSTFEIFMIGGGGGGGNHVGGGGGAGAYYYTNGTPLNVSAGTIFNITVGAGGQGGTGLYDPPYVSGQAQKGSDTFIKINGNDYLRVAGGGGGGGYVDGTGVGNKVGGCGGGAQTSNSQIAVGDMTIQGGSVITGTNGTGYPGGNGVLKTNPTSATPGGGGGAGGAGGNANMSVTPYVGGKGGNAITISLSGSELVFGGGGGGGGLSPSTTSIAGVGGSSIANGVSVKVGGDGGPGASMPGGHAVVNTGSGGGGGGASSGVGGNGSGGRVIIKVLTNSDGAILS